MRIIFMVKKHLAHTDNYKDFVPHRVCSFWFSKECYQTGQISDQSNHWWFGNPLSIANFGQLVKPIILKEQYQLFKIFSNSACKWYYFVRKTKNYLEKTPNNLEKLHPDFSEEGKKERQQHRWVCGCFCQNLAITADTSKTLKIYSSFKSKFSFNNRNIVKIYVILELGKMLVLMIFLN